MLDIVAHLPIATAVVSLLGAAYSLTQAIFALRAKRRLKRILSKYLTADILAREGMVAYERSELVSQRRAILKASMELSKRDRQFVFQGLKQQSRVGSQNFVHELSQN